MRALRRVVADSAIDATGKYEIDFRVAQKERQFQDALVIASDLRLEAVATDPVVTPGQNVRVSLIAANRGKAFRSAVTST